MAYRSLGEQSLDEFVDYISRFNTIREAAEALGINESTLHRVYRRKTGESPITLREAMSGVKSKAIEIKNQSELLSSDDEIIIPKGTRGVVTSDWHIPLVDAEAVEVMLQEAVRNNATDYLVIAGDFLNLDALSRFPIKQRGSSLENELLVAREIIQELVKTFDSIIITKGNHDERLWVALGDKVSYKQTIGWLLGLDVQDKVRLTSRDNVTIETLGEHNWYICHTRQYSKVPLKIPIELAAIHEMNIAAGHRHHHAIGNSLNGKYRVVELGGLYDTQATEYIKSYSNTMPRWVNGFMILDEYGIPYLPMLAPSPL